VFCLPLQSYLVTGTGDGEQKVKVREAFKNFASELLSSECYRLNNKQRSYALLNLSSFGASVSGLSTWQETDRLEPNSEAMRLEYSAKWCERLSLRRPRPGLLRGTELE